MTFTEAVQTCLSEKYFTIEGRASRSEYWWFALAECIFIFIGTFFMEFGAQLYQTEESLLYLLIALMGLLVILALVIPSITVCIRRLHDTNRSGWWYLANFIPGVGGIILLVLTLMPSEEGENEYGPNPTIAEEC